MPIIVGYIGVLGGVEGDAQSEILAHTSLNHGAGLTATKGAR